MTAFNTLVCDLDGTLMNHFGDISRQNRNILIQLYQKGLYIGIASGRSIENIREILKNWDIEYLVSFIIGNNGCDYLSLESGQTVCSSYIGMPQLEDITKACANHPVVVGFRHHKQLYWQRFSLYALASTLMHSSPLHFSGFESADARDFPKVYVIGNPRHIESLYHILTFKDLKIIPTGKYVLEIVHKDVSKYEGLKHAIREFNLNPSEILYFGDDYNDLEIARRTYGIAMKNGTDLLKEVCRATTKYTNSQDGFAYHINSMLSSSRFEFGQAWKTPACDTDRVPDR